MNKHSNRTMYPRRGVLLALPLVLATVLAPGAPGATGAAGARAGEAELASRLDAVVREAYPAGGPGASVIVQRGGETLLEAGYGLANLELDVPLTKDSVFRLGSITKQFTGVAILTLVEADALTLDDSVDELLPRFEIDPRITISQLLAHTSGLKSYTDVPEFMGRVREEVTPDEMLELILGLPVEFEPGERWMYSNSGYFVLGVVIEELSGIGYAEYLQRELFEPAGMLHTRYGSEVPIIPARASGYSRDERGEWRNSAFLSMSIPYAAGSLLSTVGDLLRWNTAVLDGTLLGADSTERAFTPFELDDGSSTGYGCGWMIADDAGRLVVRHNGGIFGFSTFAVSYPEDGVYVAVLCNAEVPDVGPQQVAEQLAGLVLD